jgi:hypothetical protein
LGKIPCFPPSINTEQRFSPKNHHNSTYSVIKLIWRQCHSFNSSRKQINPPETLGVGDTTRATLEGGRGSKVTIDPEGNQFSISGHFLTNCRKSRKAGYGEPLMENKSATYILSYCFRSNLYCQRPDCCRRRHWARTVIEHLLLLHCTQAGQPIMRASNVEPRQLFGSNEN